MVSRVDPFAVVQTALLAPQFLPFVHTDFGPLPMDQFRPAERR